MIYSLGERVVETTDDSYWIAPNAAVIGSVTLGRDVGIWFSAVLRGDMEPIVIGDGSNVQDCCVLHTDPGAPLTIGKNVTVGHSATLHGCEIGDDTLIGICATVLSHAKVGKNCLIGAHALVGEGKEIPDNSMVLGTPGKVVRDVSPETLAGMKANNEFYRHNQGRFKDELKLDDRS
ncbi:MAG: gamma carbonic anhydrase family protein [Rhodospirillales bacterium]|nr:gamma carbonic anhydrase family protein [Rhodospirillales bacterium]